MINESEGEEGAAVEGEEGGADQPGVIQVSPQDKEAIERVIFYGYDNKHHSGSRQTEGGGYICPN